MIDDGNIGALEGAVDVAATMLPFVFKKRRRTLLQAGNRINSYSSSQINANANTNANATIARRGGRRVLCKARRAVGAF